MCKKDWEIFDKHWKVWYNNYIENEDQNEVLIEFLILALMVK